MPALSSFSKEWIIDNMTDRIRQLNKVIEDLQEENAKLKREYEHLCRKIAHGCTDANCSLCDGEQVSVRALEQ